MADYNLQSAVDYDLQSVVDYNLLGGFVNLKYVRHAPFEAWLITTFKASLTTTFKAWLVTIYWLVLST